MKKILSVLGLSIALTTTGLTAHATSTDTTTTDQIEVKAGIKPTSPFYFLDKGMEKVQLWLATNDEKKAELKLQFAEERLGELNAIPQDKVKKYVDDLMDEYTNNVDYANSKLNQLVDEGKISEKTALKLTNKLNHTVDVSSTLDTDVVDHMSQEIQTKVSTIKNMTYLTTLASGMTKDQIDTLKDQGFGYGEILKLNAISQITGKSIEDLQLLDIYNDLGELDFAKVATELNITEDQVMAQIKDYRDAVKETVKAEVEKKVEAAKEKAKKHLDDLKKEINDENEANIEQAMQSRLSELNASIDQQVLISIDAVDQLVQQGLLTADDENNVKLALTSPVDDQSSLTRIQSDLLGQIKDNKLRLDNNVQISLEINQVIQDTLKDKLSTISLSDVDFTQIPDTNVNKAQEIIVISNLFNDPTALINDTLSKIEDFLASKNVTLTDAQKQAIETKVNEAVQNGQIDMNNYNEMLTKVINLVKDQFNNRDSKETLILGMLMKDLNQFRNRFHEENENDNEDVVIAQQYIDLFNNYVTSLNLESWNNLTTEQQQEVRQTILSHIDLTQTDDLIQQAIQDKLNDAINHVLSEQDNDDEAVIIPQADIDLFNSYVTSLNLDAWNNLTTEQQQMVRQNILSHIDLTQTDEQIEQAIQDKLNDAIQKIVAREEEKEEASDIMKSFVNNYISSLNLEGWNTLTTDEQNQIKEDILSQLDFHQNFYNLRQDIKDLLTQAIEKYTSTDQTTTDTPSTDSSSNQTDETTTDSSTNSL